MGFLEERDVKWICKYLSQKKIKFIDCYLRAMFPSLLLPAPPARGSNIGKPAALKTVLILAFRAFIIALFSLPLQEACWNGW